jgi:hypothetical protein
MNGVCPKCGVGVNQVFLSTVPVIAPAATWDGVTYNCPNRRAILSVGLDPIVLRDSIVDDIVNKLKR